MDILKVGLSVKAIRVMSGSEWVKRFPRVGRKRTEAFTLGDLVAVLAMLSLLVTIFFPALYHGKMIVQAGACLSDLHQIQDGWILYNNENNGNFPCNVTGAGSAGLNWVANFENYSSASTDTNGSLLVNPQYSLLAPYVRNPSVYRCPADESKSSVLAGQPRVRSYSMSAAIGPNTNGTVYGANLTSVVQGKWLDSPSDAGQVNQPNYHTVYLNNRMMIGPLQPSDLIVLVDQNPDSISDGSFAFNMPSAPTQTYWINYPTPLHGNAGSLSFADGHAAIHPWQLPAAIPSVTYSHQTISMATAVPKDPDVTWLASHISTVYPQ